MLKQRILTALILLPLMLAMLFFAGNTLWAAFAALIALLALWEYSRMAGFGPAQQTPYLAGTAFFMLTAHAGGWQLPPFVWAIVFAFWLLAMPAWLNRKWKIQADARGMAIGWLLMLPFWFALIALRPTSSGATARHYGAGVAGGFRRLFCGARHR